jgi:hypothetical protein
MPYPVVHDIHQLWHDGKLYWLDIRVIAEPAEPPEPRSWPWFPMRTDWGRRIADLVRADLAAEAAAGAGPAAAPA